MTFKMLKKHCAECTSIQWNNGQRCMQVHGIEKHRSGTLFANLCGGNSRVYITMAMAGQPLQLHDDVGLWLKARKRRRLYIGPQRCLVRCWRLPLCARIAGGAAASHRINWHSAAGPAYSACVRACWLSIEWPQQRFERVNTLRLHCPVEHRLLPSSPSDALIMSDRANVLQMEVDWFFL